MTKKGQKQENVTHKVHK